MNPRRTVASPRPPRLARRTRPEVLATSDCETCRPGWITQPANTVSSLAYVVAGLDAGRAARRLDPPERAPHLALAVSLVGTGLGSVAYHGPGGALSRWAHDATLVTTLGLLLQTDLRALAGRPPAPPLVLATVPVAAAVGCGPRTSMAVQVGVGTASVAASWARLRRERRSPEAASARAADLLTWAAGIAAHLAGRTESPLCRPPSLAQPHAAWHVLSAAALRGALRSRLPAPSTDWSGQADGPEPSAPR